MKRVLILFVLFLIPLFHMNTAAAQEMNISIIVDGSYIYLDSYPVVKEGRTLVPLRGISEAMNAKVDWNESQQKITISKGKIRNELTVNSKTALKITNGTQQTIVTLDVPATIINKRTYVPIRYIAESFDANVQWDAKAKKITVESPFVLSINQKTVAIGDRLNKVTQQFGEPDRIDPTAFDFDWYVFGVNTEDYMLVAIKDKIVTGYFTCSQNFIINDIVTFGSTKDVVQANLKNNRLIAYYDQHNDDTLHGIMYVDGYFSIDKYLSNIEKIAKSNENHIFDLTNVFRLQHHLSILDNNSIAQKTAKLHSQDLADQNYFSHTGKDGSSPWDRYKRLGGNYVTAGENIAAGRNTGIGSFYGWLNSLGHRQNMLNPSFTEIGVGEGYNADSMYRFYHTQFFVTPR